MNPDLEKRVPREILAELIEEGTEAFRGILEKLFNVAMQLERSEFLGAEAYERTASRLTFSNSPAKTRYLRFRRRRAREISLSRYSFSAPRRKVWRAISSSCETGITLPSQNGP